MKFTTLKKIHELLMVDVAALTSTRDQVKKKLEDADEKDIKRLESEERRAYIELTAARERLHEFEEAEWGEIR